MSALFKIWSKQHDRAVSIYGVRQTRFLVWTTKGWSWVDHSKFIPMTSSPYEESVAYEESVFYTGQREES
jgi:hypothetical protein